MTGNTASSAFTILLGGALTPTPRLLHQIAGSRVVAADAGMAHAEALGVEVELWVGDFDSSSPKLQAAYPTVARLSYPADKAKTDGELAIDAAIARGGRELVLVGGLGGQTDHALGHLALLIALARRGIRAFATSGLEEAYPLIPGEMLIGLPSGSRLSLIAFSDISGLTLSGVRWPLQNAAIPAGSTRTISNVANGKVAITIAAGGGIAVAYPGVD